ncbi:MAG: NAD-dependent epimerase/dehydratase family protein [Trueperaceae bacterium]|nr:NAD-dependent epimerase/dehydratase family protein [Trueperaceae bacterium]
MKRLILVGARSFVALPLVQNLQSKNYQITVVSRQPEALASYEKTGCEVVSLKELSEKESEGELLVSLMPIWEMARLMPELKLRGLKKVVVVSSSSVLNKQNSSWPSDLALVERLQGAEKALQTLCKSKGITLIILRPTLVFGYGLDKNLSLIVKNLRRLHIMPLFGQAQGLRQPLHAADLARAICLALEAEIGNRCLSLGGATRIPYRDLIKELARAHNIPYIFLPIPKLLLVLGLNVLKLLPKYRFLELAMFERMNKDLIVDNSEIESLLGFQAMSLQQALERHS